MSIYRKHASELFNVPVDAITDEQEKEAREALISKLVVEAFKKAGIYNISILQENMFPLFRGGFESSLLQVSARPHQQFKNRKLDFLFATREGKLRIARVDMDVLEKSFVNWALDPNQEHTTHDGEAVMGQFVALEAYLGQFGEPYRPHVFQNGDLVEAGNEEVFELYEDVYPQELWDRA